MPRHYLTAALALAAVVAVMVLVVPDFAAMSIPEPIRQGPGVTAVKQLSDYFPGLKDTAGDTEVYILDSGKPGGTVLVLGGTHPNEPAAFLAATLLVENARPAAGRLIVIPRANASGFTHGDYMEGAPDKFTIRTANGERSFRYGSRATNPIHQWPDPDIYVHAASGQKLSGSETRNLNRTYPGRPNGNLTEKVAYAIVQVIKTEKANVSIDYHEASPEYPVINAIVAHERAMDVAAEAAMELQLDGIKFGLEPSPKKLRGLSHREWGDATETLAILMESSNPAQGRLRGKTDEELVLTGKDRMYVQAAKLGRLFVPTDDNGHPISERVARHLAATAALIKAFNHRCPGASVALDGLPSYDQLVKQGIGAYLK
jgi:hypothetical protein